MRKRAGIIIYNTNSEEILLIRRYKNNKSYYVVPGGGVEKGETIVEAARRELSEELDYQAGNIYFLFKTENEFYYYTLVEQSYTFSISGEEKVRQNNNNIYEPQWVHIDKLSELVVYPICLRKEVARIKEHLGKKSINDKFILAIEGANSSGKSSFVNEVLKKYKFFKTVDFEYDKCIEEYTWWFEKSTPMELTKGIIDILLQRDRKISNLNENFIILDKGIITLRSRLLATLLCRGIDDIEIGRCLELFDIETNKITKYYTILLNDQTLETNMPVSELYGIYLEHEKKEISKSNADYVMNNCETFMVEFISILKEIIEKFITQCLRRDILVLGISGLSETGKSFCGNILNREYGAFNLKIKYFDNLLAKYFKVYPDEELYPVLMCLQLWEFLDDHYYVNVISLESFHNIKLACMMKKIFGKQFKILYLQTLDSVRILRSLEGEKQIKEKDKIKISRGVLEIEKIADCILDNSSNEFALNDEIHTIIDIKQNDIKVKYGKNDNGSYMKIANELKHFLITTEKENIKFFAVTGSCATMNQIALYSDLDILIITSNYSVNFNQYARELETKYDLHIGISQFTEYEVERRYIDLKTIYNIYLFNKKVFSISYISENYRLPHILPNEFENCRKIVISTIIFKYRRYFANSWNDMEEREIEKDLILLLKMIYIKKNIFYFTIDDFKDIVQDEYGLCIRTDSKSELLKSIEEVMNLSDG